jgi:hypothetical protein
MSAAPLSAQARLNLSRLRLSLVLHQAHANQAQPQPAHSAGANHWADSLSQDPGVRMLLHTVAAWWAQHPLQNAASMVALATRELLRPMAQRSPVALVLGAAAVGGALVLLKPWRWVSVPTLAAGLLPQLLARLAAQMRPQSWAELLASWLKVSDPPVPPT